MGNKNREYPLEVYSLIRSLIEGKRSQDKALRMFCIDVLQQWDYDRSKGALNGN